MNASGKISFGSLVLLAIVSAALYAGVLAAPVLGDHFEVKEHIHKMVNRAYQLDDRSIAGQLSAALEKVGTRFKLNPYGELEEVVGLGVRPEQVIVERNTVTQTIRVAIPYQRQVRLKPTAHFISVQFNPEREGSTVR